MRVALRAPASGTPRGVCARPRGSAAPLPAADTPPQAGKLEAVFRLDHIPFGVDDIEATNERLQALGFTTVRSRCRWPMPAATYSAPALSIMFAETYIDVIGYKGAASGLTPSGVVLGTGDFDAAIAHLKGFEVRPYEIERTLEDGQSILYRITGVRGPANLPISLLQDGAPGAMRTARALRHANGARALSCVALRATDLGRGRRDLERLTTDVMISIDIASIIEFKFEPIGLRYPW